MRCLYNKIVLFIFTLILPFIITNNVYSSAFSIDASVDKSEVKFGESVQLLITIAMEISGGGAPQISPPSITEIPGFDIVGKRSTHGVSIINNRGIVQIQTIIELVPKKPGINTIPALSVVGPDGKTYSTKPINLNVLPPSESDDDSTYFSTKNINTTSANNITTTGKTSISILSLLLIFLGVICLLIGAPILLSWYLNRNYSSKSKWDEPLLKEGTIEHGDTSNLSNNISENNITPSETNTTSNLSSKNEFISIDQIQNYFDKKMSELILKNKETNIKFYKNYFELFKEIILLLFPNEIKNNMTPSEIVNLLKQKLSSETHYRLDKILDNWEETIFANILPNRSWQNIVDDTKFIINEIIKKKNSRM